MVSVLSLLSFTQELFPSTRFVLVLTYWAWRARSSSSRTCFGSAKLASPPRARRSACPDTNDRDQSSRSRLLEKGQLGFRFLRTNAQRLDRVGRLKKRLAFTPKRKSKLAERKLRFNHPELALEWDKIQRRERRGVRFRR